MTLNTKKWNQKDRYYQFLNEAKKFLNTDDRLKIKQSCIRIDKKIRGRRKSELREFDKELYEFLKNYNLNPNTVNIWIRQDFNENGCPYDEINAIKAGSVLNKGHQLIIEFIKRWDYEKV